MGEFRYSYRLAGPTDTAQIKEILEESDFKGKISLLYSRRPDAFHSFMQEGKQVAVYTCRQQSDTADTNNPILGIGACAVNTVFIEGEERSAGYLFGFRLRKILHPIFAAIPKGYQFLFNHLEQWNVSDYFTTILSENHAARRMLEKKRRFMPRYRPMGEITTFTLKTGGSAQLPKGWSFTQVKESDLSELIQFYHDQGSQYLYFPVLTKEDMLKGRGCPHYSCFNILRDQDLNIIAAGAVWNQQDYKQYRIMGYSGLYRFLQPLSSWLFPLLGFPALPKAGKVLNMFSLAFLAVKESDPKVFKIFLKQMLQKTASYHSCTFGLHEKHPLISAARRFRGIAYKSRLYRVTPPGQPDQSFSGIPHIETGRL